MAEPQVTRAELAAELERVESGARAHTVALAIELASYLWTRGTQLRFDEGAAPGEVIRRVAATCHEINRVWCEAHHDYSQPAWTEAPEWQRTSAFEGVLGILSGEIQTPEQAHESWTEAKLRDGWTFGPVKDPSAKTHPCLVPYGELPLEQRQKDALFHTIVHTLAPLVTGDRHT